MKYLNLTEGFNPFNAQKRELINFESFFFSGGEPHIKLDINSFHNEAHDVQVSIRLKSMNDLGLLLVATDALRQCGYMKESYLFIPYFFGSRQDRRMVPGEPLTVRVIADIINELGYNLIDSFDNHSDVSTALIDNGSSINNHEFVKHCLNHVDTFFPITLISPDSGANKKMKDLCMSLGDKLAFDLVKCDKSRNVTTGELKGFEVYADDLENRDCFIIDDICDGGGTFIGLAEELKKKNAGDLYLIISHGIFSKGFKELSKHFKKIFTTDSWNSDIALEVPENEKHSEIVKIIKFNEFLV